MNELLNLTYEELNQNFDYLSLIANPDSKFTKIVFTFKDGVVNQIETVP